MNTCTNGTPFLRIWARLAIAVGVIFSVTACAIPVLEPSTTFRFELEGTADGKPFSFQQYYTCHQIAVLSAADGKFHKQWSASGAGTQVGQVGDNLFIIYNAWGCDPNASKRSVIAAVDSVENPKTLRLFRAQSPEPLITITKDRLLPVEASNVTLGPPAAQVQLKETLRENQRGFQRVTAKIVPYEVVATSAEARAYFDKLKGVELGTQQDRVKEQLVFPFFSQRDFGKLRTNSEYKKDLALSFSGEEFVLEDLKNQSSDVYYSTPSTRASATPWKEPIARVRYKNARFEVLKVQEIYDADLRSIIVFYNEHRSYPWPSPEDADIKRLESRKGW